MRRTILVAFTALVVACDTGADEAPAVTTADADIGFTALQRTGCDSDDRSLSAAAIEMLTDTAIAVRVNETHDCQRLIHGTRFGPLVAIYPMKSIFHGPPDQFEDGWVPIASVQKWGSEIYTPLQIFEERNCLFLRRYGDEWQGLMRGGAFCPDNDVPDTASKNLEAIAQIYDGPEPGTKNRPVYPATARFRWDATGTQFYVGIKCGLAWCSIGADGALPVSDPIKGPLLETMPGYFDEQPVPIVDGNSLIVGPVVRISATRRLHDLPDNPGMELTPHTFAQVSMQLSGPAGAFDSIVMEGLHLGRSMPIPDRATANIMIKSRPYASRHALAVRPGTNNRPLTLGVDSATMHAGPGTVRWRWIDQSSAMSTTPSNGAALPRSTSVDSLSPVAIAAVVAPAAAWIPCQADNCCTATW